MMPKNEKELELFFMLMELYEMNKIVKGGPWLCGTGEEYSRRVNTFNEAKEHYIKEMEIFKK